ncbi:hypothetical protein [Vulcanisaeta distributa]|uniref:hypothetical protein n=1 Tax=Vulcanisaeta distributa TaxID=164451 RepID=UPI001FB27760|nr:hypothetical protein [Vulcanisaeta distributa]
MFPSHPMPPGSSVATRVITSALPINAVVSPGFRAGDRAGVSINMKLGLTL